MAKGTNPINLMKSRSESAEKRYNDLEKKHKKLIAESIEIENRCNDYEGAITNFCDGCSLKGSADCNVCPLYDVATKNTLWREL